MRKIFLLLIAALTVITMSAQPRGRVHKDRDEGKPTKEERFQQMQSAKIAHFTTELALTPEEAQVFWPVYNQYCEELMSLRKENRGAFGKICELMESGSYTEEEMKEALHSYAESFKGEEDIQEKYLEEFIKILPIDKVAKIYLCEESFRHHMIDKFRNPDNRPNDRPSDDKSKRNN